MKLDSHALESSNGVCQERACESVLARFGIGGNCSADIAERSRGVVIGSVLTNVVRLLVSLSPR